MALYRYIVTQSDKELVLEHEAVSDAVAYREGVRFAAELLAELSSSNPMPIVLSLVVECAEREIWRVNIDAPAPPDLRS